MIGISSLVQWWGDWQLRVLVLGSLGLQWFLLLAAPMRKYTAPHALRTCIWLAYISSDALAIYALATLFNRHARTVPATYCIAPPSAHQGKEQSRIREVLWEPVLLIHLGGQEGLKAYKIEDIDQWMRQTVTLVRQVAVALYAFYKSWQPSWIDTRLTVATALLFVIGVFNFSEKPIALNRAKSRRIKRLAAVSASRSGLKKEVVLSSGDKVLMVLSDMSLLTAAKELVAWNRAKTVEDVLPPLPVAKKSLARWLRNAFAFIYTKVPVPHLTMPETIRTDTANLV